jgi:hypothetical protein
VSLDKWARPWRLPAWGTGSAGDLEIRLAGVPDHQFSIWNIVGQRPGKGLVRVQPVRKPAINQPAAQFAGVSLQHHGQIKHVRQVHPGFFIQQQVVAFGDQETVAGPDDAAAGAGEVEPRSNTGNGNVAVRFVAQAPHQRGEPVRIEGEGRALAAASPRASSTALSK